MALERANRISVVRGSELVPLLPGHSGARGAQPWSRTLLERHAVRSSEIPEHEHREFCIHLQLAGNSDFEWWSAGRHGVERTQPGSLILLAPGTRDRLRWEGTSERLILSLDPQALRETMESLEIAGEPEVANKWALQDAALENLLREMGREAAVGWPFGKLYADMLQGELTRQLLQRHAANPVALPVLKGRLPMARLRLLFEYIHANLDRDLSLQELAAQVELSGFHFAREFKASTGKSAHQYVLDQRMARAKDMLRRKGVSVQEIAAEVGFGSAVNFVRAFRQRVGVTPGAWRECC